MRKNHNILLVSTLSEITFLLLVLMSYPLFTALSAGIAGLSVLIFSPLLILLIFIAYRSRHNKTRLLVSGIGIASALVGLFGPLYIMSMTSTRYDTSLSFDPVSYVSFSGKTTISPNETYVYKQNSTRDLSLAVYRPISESPTPVVAILHGGGWRYGSHLETGTWPEILTNAGFSVISIDYSLSSEADYTWVSAVEDVRSAINYIQSEHKKLNISPDKVHLLGQSAGGHLALLEAYQNNHIASVISLYAPVDLVLDYETSRDKSAEINLIGGTPLEYPERYRQLSPLTYVSPNSPASLIIQGTYDDLVSHKNASLIAETLKQNNVKHEVVILPMTGHSFENQKGGFSTQMAHQVALRFLNNR